MRARRKKWLSPYLESHPGLSFDSLSLDDPFLKEAPLYLEIGSGKGDFLLGISKIEKGHYLGIEKVAQVVAIAEKKRAEENNEDVRFLIADIDFALEKLKDLRFKVIFLNFSDPWPKKCHAKRRLTYAPRLERIISILDDNGELRIKTDNEGLYEFTLEQVEKLPLTQIYATTDYSFDNEHDAMSEYERAFREEGKNIFRLIYKKEEQR